MAELDILVGKIPMGLNFQVYITTAQIPSNCNSIIFRNQGTSVCTIENVIILQPGQSFEVSGNAGEYITNAFTAIFASGGTNSLLVVSKVFV
jgi:hypothetical protein